MSKTIILKELNRIFCDVFDDESIVITDKTSAIDIEDWDSLSHVMLLSSIEKKFGIKFNMKEVQTLDNVGDMVDLIAEYI